MPNIHNYIEKYFTFLKNELPNDHKLGNFSSTKIADLITSQKVSFAQVNNTFISTDEENMIKTLGSEQPSQCFNIIHIFGHLDYNYPSTDQTVTFPNKAHFVCDSWVHLSDKLSAEDKYFFEYCLKITVLRICQDTYSTAKFKKYCKDQPKLTFLFQEWFLAITSIWLVVNFQYKILNFNTISNIKDIIKDSFTEKKSYLDKVDKLNIDAYHQTFIRNLDIQESGHYKDSYSKEQNKITLGTLKNHDNSVFRKLELAISVHKYENEFKVRESQDIFLQTIVDEFNLMVA